jgi:hypothetical protein
MLRRVTMAAVVAVVAAAMVVPAALAQDDYSTTQVEYGDDVYSGTDSGNTAGTESSGQSGGAWTKFTAKLTGEVEVPAGDPDGSGTAAIKTRGTEVCYDISWKGIDANLSHIHKAPAGKAGGPVVNLFASESPLDANKKSGCVTGSATVVKAMAANPSNYYVNVHSPEFPKGAIRGQLVLVGANGNQLAFTGGPMSRGLMLLGLCVIAAGSTLLAVGQRRRVAYHRPRH